MSPVLVELGPGYLTRRRCAAPRLLGGEVGHPTVQSVWLGRSAGQRLKVPGHRIAGRGRQADAAGTGLRGVVGGAVQVADVFLVLGEIARVDDPLELDRL